MSENMKIVMVGEHEEEYLYGVYTSDIATIVADRLMKMTDEPVSISEACSYIPPEPPEGCTLFHLVEHCEHVSIYAIPDALDSKPEYFWAKDVESAKQQWAERLGSEYAAVLRLPVASAGVWLTENKLGYGIEYNGKHYCYVVKTADTKVYVLSKGEIVDGGTDLSVFDVLQQLREDPSILNCHEIPDELPTSLTPDELAHNLRVMDERAGLCN